MTESKNQSRNLRKRGVYLLPSLLTSMGLFAGFFSIIHSVRGMGGLTEDFQWSAYAIIIAAFLDGLDGRIARLMKVESEFGFQFDSIADVVSFGVAPAVLIYASTLHPLGRWGWFGAFLFVACAGIRLARFNVTSSEPGSRKYFKGMSSPVAAGGLALSVLLGYQIEGRVYQISILCYTIFLSLLMVSNVRFRSFKQIDSAKRRPLQIFLFLILLVVLLVSFHKATLAAMFIIYLVWGLTEEAILFRRRRKSDPSVPFVPFGDREDSDDSVV